MNDLKFQNAEETHENLTGVVQVPYAILAMSLGNSEQRSQRTPLYV